MERESKRELFLRLLMTIGGAMNSDLLSVNRQDEVRHFEEGN